MRIKKMYLFRLRTRVRSTSTMVGEPVEMRWGVCMGERADVPAYSFSFPLSSMVVSSKEWVAREPQSEHSHHSLPTLLFYMMDYLIQHFAQPLYLVEQNISLLHHLLILCTLERRSCRLYNPVHLVYRTM